jgi:phage repressor protein C with HTH and peptisase S24 domain
MTDHPSSRPNRDRQSATLNAHDPEVESERDADRLVCLLGARALADIDPESEAGARFHEWWARDLRARTARTDLDAAAESFEARMRTRVAEREYRVRIVERTASFRTPASEGSVSSMVAAARAHQCAPVLGQGVAAGAGRDLWDEPCTSWVELPEDVAPGQHVALTVRGDSMEPLLHAGDTILIKLDSELRRGAVVVARRPDDGYVVKRVSRVGPKVVELASLNPGYPPIRIPRRAELILGTVLMCWRHASQAVT